MTAASPTPRRAPDVLAGLVAVASAVVFLMACAGLMNLALSRAPVPPGLTRFAVVAHLSTILLALPLGISQLLLPKGTLRHRTVGYIWLAAMTLTALASFGIHTINPGGFSPIHILSIGTLVLVPIIVWRARHHEVKRHRDAVLGLMIGGLVIAGLLTFLPGRILGRLLHALIASG